MKVFTTGQAARELGVSAYTIRRLCAAGKMKHSRIGKGQRLMIPAEEVERLQEEGMPSLPAELASEGPTSSAIAGSAGSVTPPDPAFRHDLFREPSEELAESREQVVALQQDVEKAGLEQQLTEYADQAEDRERERQDREDERDRKQQQRWEADRQEKRNITAAQERRKFESEWLNFAVGRLPYDARQELSIQLADEVQEALGRTAPDRPESFTRRLVVNAVDKVLRPWRKAQDRLQQQESHKQAIDSKVRWVSISGATRDELRDAEDSAREALEALPSGATDHQMTRAVEQATKEIRDDVATRQREENATRDRKHRIDIFLIGQIMHEALKDASFAEKNEAGAAVRAALEELPELTDKAMKAAQEPILDEFREIIEEQRAKEERKRRKQQAGWNADRIFSGLASYLHRKYGYDSRSDATADAKELERVHRKDLIKDYVNEHFTTEQEMRDCLDEHAEEWLGDEEE